ncbi:large subunit ribosomal protein L3 [Verrucomicrobium sp. GAS474]|uniref:50S ribosomal protein L3 n=1 Tax=Verrucomicrobium sp. GAS474 TaxID=1882831 RepID=UPI0008799C6B|nr:50S ribosomal protein L3 [Verrucomicrobium sp. GAS474]SDU26200.1 large subunit ribosomal protein L3 [Verrucomicrobium sp. GAS474]
MSVGILGKKIGMTRVYDEAGVSTPVTVISAAPNVVLQVKGLEKDKYQAIQVGFSEQKEQRLSKPVAGHFKKAGVSAKRFVREFRTGTGDDFKVGDEIKVDRFTVGQTVDVIGVSKGKGFQGPMKKHNFHGQGAAHGSKTHRRNGAVGQRSTPGRIFKNMGMAGHMGDENKTVQNLRVIQVRPDDNTLVISGAIPGANGNLVVVRTAIKGQPKVKKVAASKSANPMKESKKKK